MKKKTLSILILTVLILGVLGYFDLFINSSVKKDTIKYEMPAAQGDAPCPPDTTECSTGDSRACCQSEDRCRKANGNAWCSRKPEDCQPPATWCGAGTGGGSGDGTCCPPEKQCFEKFGYSWCGKKSDDDCTSRGGRVCGNFCCMGSESCNGVFFKTCSKTSCPSGQEMCSGASTTICCHSGQCISSSNGAANCADDQPNPPASPPTTQPSNPVQPATPPTIIPTTPPTKGPKESVPAPLP